MKTNEKIILFVSILIVALGVYWFLSQPASCSSDLDCPPQMKCENSVCIDVGCVGEGGTIPGAISPEYREHMATECCEGLEAITYSGYFDENCGRVPLDGAPAGVCSNCGNKICEQWETKCNCPGDCTEASGCE
ncbi:MAG: hypothetical protein U9M95_00005, partial [Candidatus Altiarchaeota archaeon]|nr:hypothetical protein [Candidatus Altiarchaeota archaeon]